jgi:hypothetical protein
LDGLINELQQQENPNQRPASKFIQKNLPVAKNSTLHKSCPICVMDFEFKSNDPRELPCKHVFHQQCIQPWLENRNTCPLCRNELATDDLAYEKIRKEKARKLKLPGYESEEEWDPYYS